MRSTALTMAFAAVPGSNASWRDQRSGVERLMMAVHEAAWGYGTTGQKHYATMLRRLLYQAQQQGLGARARTVAEQGMADGRVSGRPTRRRVAGLDGFDGAGYGGILDTPGGRQGAANVALGLVFATYGAMNSAARLGNVALAVGGSLAANGLTGMIANWK